MFWSREQMTGPRLIAFEQKSRMAPRSYVERHIE